MLRRLARNGQPQMDRGVGEFIDHWRCIRGGTERLTEDWEGKWRGMSGGGKRTGSGMDSGENNGKGCWGRESVASISVQRVCPGSGGGAGPDHREAIQLKTRAS